MLNYHVHSMSQRAEIKTARSDLQHIRDHHGEQELVQDCRNGEWCFPKAIERPRVLHFCGRKPFLFDRKAYSKPFTIARLEHYRKQQGNSSAWRGVLNEECRRVAIKLKGRLAI
jgi:hypothetical protein